MEKQSVKIIIADDHPLFRSGLVKTIQENSDYISAGESATGTEALEQIRTLKPEIAILDINMPGMNGLEVTKIVNKEKLPTKIIILTMYKDEDYFNEAINLDVSAYILKDCATNEILKCLEEVLSGEYYFSPGVLNYLVKRKSKKTLLQKEYSGLKGLTVAEKQVLEKVAENKTSKEIAEELFISARTVQNHRNNICTKLNLKGYNKLLQFAINNRNLF
ncbi:MAG: response regulator transcription factor [Ignavibacteriae bacterium]|nr:response regulator transcription factor [Ignavibacteriota bacterium]